MVDSTITCPKVQAAKAAPVAILFWGLATAAVVAAKSEAETSELELVERAEGREGVRHCYLIAAVPPPLPPLPRPPPKEPEPEDDPDLPPGW